MRTIIAGTDFSPSSLNACRYAALLAQKLNCKLTLFNMFEAPLIHSNIGLYGLSYSAIRKTSEKKTQQLSEELRLLFPKLKIDQFVSSGTFKTELENFTSKHQVLVAVMGLETKNWLLKSIYGSHGVNIAGKIDTPVIIVPKKYREHHLSNILLAVDNNEKLHKSSLSGFENFLKEAKMSLKLLHVKTKDEIFAPVSASVKINNRNYKIMELKSKNLKSGIKEFCRNEPIDLVSLISKKHSVFYNFYSESNTSKVAFTTSIPVMAIHE